MSPSHPHVILLEGSPRPQPEGVAARASEIRDSLPGARVSAIVYGPLALDGLVDAIDDVVVLAPDAPPVPGKASAPVRVMRLLRRLVTGGGIATRFTRRVRRDDAAQALLAQADVVVAVDSSTIRPAWHLVRARRVPRAVYGVAAVRELRNT